jgi:hypothetical protein
MILEHVLASLKSTMNDEIYLKYIDDKMRFCFLILCQYLVDYEEQILLANLVKEMYSKCVDECDHLEAFRRLDQREPVSSWINSVQSRLNEEVYQLRENFADGKITLKQLENK